MNTATLTMHVELLVAKAAQADKPDDAMKLAQAALNAANAALGLETLARARAQP